MIYAMKNTESLKKETDKLSHYADHVDRENESDRAFENTNEIQNTEPEEDTANKDEKNEEKSNDQFEGIIKSGSVAPSSSIDKIYCLTIIGQIEGHYALGEGQKATKYEHIIPLLVSIEEDKNIEGVLIILNTMGGDVEAGLAIAEMISSMTKPTVSLVLGGGHSIGVPLAVSAERSFIVPSATMTIHPVRINGLVVGVPQTFNYFNEMQKRIIGFICKHSNASENKIYELMMKPDMLATDVGSIITGEEAVKYGIIDEIGGLDHALNALRSMIKEHKDKAAVKDADCKENF